MDFWEDLLDFIKDERVVPVVGPELLRIQVNGQQVLLYHHIATQLAVELGINAGDLPENYTINDVVCKYLQAGKPPSTIYRRIRSILEKAPPVLPEPLRKLARIRPLKLFVSTTFDTLLEQALNAERYGNAARTVTRVYVPNQLRDEADLPADYHNKTEPIVFRLFGKASAIPDYVVTEEDTLEFISSLQSKERRPNLLFDELKNNHLLLIGNSFSDWLARFFIRLARGGRFSSGNNLYLMQYLAEERLRKDSNFIFFLSSFGRNQAEVYTESGPIEFVDELWRRWQERYPEDTKPVEPDEVRIELPGLEQEESAIFLSYAREDAEAAKRIASILEGAGITVWLDRDQIRHGEAWSEKIRQNIMKCALFFPLISHHTHSRRRGVFYEEWRCAEERARRMNPEEVYVIPIPIDDTPVPTQLGTKHYEVFPGGQLTPEFVSWIKRVLGTIHDRGERVGNAR